MTTSLRWLWMRWLRVGLVAVAVAWSTAACMLCGDGFIRLVEGAEPIPPGGEVGLQLEWDDEIQTGPGRCDGYWAVNGLEGGDPSVGTIDGCGRYTAPAQGLVKSVEIEGARYAPDTCADCCPFATRTVRLVAP